MFRGLRRAIALCALTILVPSASLLSGQDMQMRHNSGQSIVPVFQGWEKGPNNGFYMVFGYFNRNFGQELSVPLGPENGFSPGAVDAGQPTFFYAGVNRYIFRVAVPSDFGKKELVWTLTANGHTEKATASLLPEWEIDPTTEFGGGGTPKNQPPVVTVTPVTSSVSLPNPLKIVATITDDGNPQQSGGRGVILNQGPDAFPTLHKGERGPRNVPLLQPMPGPSRGGLSVGWVIYRAPTRPDVTTEVGEASPASGRGNTFPTLKNRAGGQVNATVNFRTPGTYVLRTIASDGQLRAMQDVTVTVTGAVR